MRMLLLSAAAAAPLLLFGAGPALADTTVESTTTPVATSTAKSGQPDNVIIASGATVNVSGPVAVTMDSSNNITNNGTISITGQNDSTTVLLNGGNAGIFSNNGTITNSESYTRTDTNGDGILDGDFAKGTGRYGVHLVGSSPLVGSFTLATGSFVTVQGKNSFGVALDAPVTGDVLQNGAIGITGETTTGFSETGGVTGKLFIGGAITATGPAAVGANIQGNVGGALSIYSAISSTGFSSTVASPDPAINAALLSSDLGISGSAVQIGGNVAHGVFLGAPPVGTVATDTTTDADGDGIVDSAEGVGSVVTYGTAPALLVGANGRDVKLGAYGTGTNAYGLIIEGTVSGNGVYGATSTTPGHSGTGVQIGVAGGTVHIDGGIHVASSGTITGQGFDNDATGIHLLAGTTVPALVNNGSISGQATSSVASQSTGLLIDANASLSSLSNTGTIGAAVTGDLGNASAIVDRSGKLSSITNTNAILATLTPAGPAAAATGKSVAIDASANTTGVTLTQSVNATATIIPRINGDILLGSGEDNVDFTAGTVQGALDFGKGSGSLTIDDGAAYTGRLLMTGSNASTDLLAINVNNGSLEDDSA
ncbi:MAG TPA: autotransporter domain-containing protein, partial [Caulobacteraceae bacterium]